MNKEILLIVDSISNEKNMEKELIFHAIEVALETITAKRYSEQVDIRVTINRKTGDYETFRRWTVVEDSTATPADSFKPIVLSVAKSVNEEFKVGDVLTVTKSRTVSSQQSKTKQISLSKAKAVSSEIQAGDSLIVVEDSTTESVEYPEKQITLSKAKAIDPELEVGDILEEPIESVKFEFGRIAAQQARQIIMREIRLAERSETVKRLKEQVSQLINGVVTKISRESVLLDMSDGMEGIMLKEDLLPREAVHIGDRVRGVLYEVKSDRKGTMLHLSRTRPEMLLELFKLEVPEINEEVIEIKAIARDPGSRSKIAVKTNDGRIDPIGACVGMRGSRVQAVSGELGGEKIDIILWDADPAQLVVNAMAPAEIASIVVDEEGRSMDLVVKEEYLAQAIGRNGQNVKLASELTKWKLNVLTVKEAEKKSKKESANVVDLFTKALDVDVEVAELLVQESFLNLEDIAYAPLADLTNIEGFDEEIAEVLRNRARDVLLEQALSNKESLSATAEPAKDLLEMEGMTRHLAYVLASHDIVTREDLAEQAVDDLSDIRELDRKKAAELIMIARKPWFEKEQTK